MKADQLIREFKKNNLSPYIEVPCSILAPLISGLTRDKACEVLNPVSEASAMGLAAGSFLITKKVPVLLMQNSGLCNTINSLTSLNQIYDIPALLVVSWRGEPGTKDAPEHDITGKKIKTMLKTLNVPYAVLTKNNFRNEVKYIVRLAKKTNKPAALILKKGIIDKEESEFALKSKYSMPLSEAIDIIMSAGHNKAYFVTTNGYISREAFYNLSKKGIEDFNPAFYMLGSMGHAHSIGLGIARHVNNDKRVIVLDGDGGCLMHLGSMASVADKKSKSLMHVVLDNGTYASTGGQPALSQNIDFCKIAQATGYKNIYSFAQEDKLRSAFPGLLKKRGAAFVHILINNENKKRPRISEKYTCKAIKEKFMRLSAKKTHREKLL
ncbi:MAG: phosphonopyruvate decarboxylase [Candidatus Omnitrophota bacterium]